MGDGFRQIVTGNSLIMVFVLFVATAVFFGTAALVSLLLLKVI